MTIIEAIKSGKRFRRGCGEFSKWAANGEFQYILRKEDILATDWEVEEEKIEVTKEQLREAWDSFMFPQPDMFAAFARKLGFKE